MRLTSSERKVSRGEILISVSFQDQTPPIIAGSRLKYSVFSSYALLMSPNSFNFKSKVVFASSPTSLD